MTFFARRRARPSMRVVVNDVVIDGVTHGWISPDGRTSTTFWRDPSLGRIGYVASYEHPRVSRWLSHCARCMTAWAFVDGHSTDDSDRSGMSILCEECWAELTPFERLPFYRVQWERWVTEARLQHYESLGELYDRWPLILDAVLAGR